MTSSCAEDVASGAGSSSCCCADSDCWSGCDVSVSVPMRQLDLSQRTHCCKMATLLWMVWTPTAMLLLLLLLLLRMHVLQRRRLQTKLASLYQLLS